MELNDSLRFLDIDDLIVLSMKLEGHGIYAIALRLGLSQAAVSLRNKKIEGHLGPGIFVRRGRNSFLTPKGTRLAKCCRYALRSLDVGTREPFEQTI